MKYLTSEHWESFSKIISTLQYPKGKLVKDGIKFENFIAELLDLKYGKNKWEQTATTYDGSKDFFLYENEKWAECKNYQTHISLDVLAPTLVMAQIFDVNEILFFSYSKIVENTKEKIIRFAEKTNKRIFFFDDEALEQLLLQYGNKIIEKEGKTLFSKYFPLFKVNEINIINSPPQFECYYIQNPFFAHDLSEKNSSLKKTFPEILYLNQVIEILISVTNITSEDAEIIVELNKDSKSDIYNFEYIMNDFQNYQIIRRISAFQNIPIKIFLRPVIFKETLIFPAIDILYKSKYSEYKHKISSVSCECNWISEGPVIGSYYNELIDKHEKICLANSRFSAFIISGPSGTGKTKILNECIKTSLKYNYRIIQFTGFRESETGNTPDSKYFLRELIFTLYNIPDGESITVSESIMNFSDKLSLNTKKAVEMIQYFEKNEFNNSEASEEYKLILFNKLCSEKTLFVIDNVQYFDNKIITFLSNLLSYCLNKNNNCNLSMLLVFNTDYMSLDSTAINLMIRLKGLELPIITENILGFRNENEAMSYLKILLNKDIDLDKEYMVKIISRTHLIPFNIRQTVEWLKDNKAIIYENNAFKLDISTFYQIIDLLPMSIYEILEDRWNSFVTSLSKGDIEACEIIFASINFFEGLSASDIKKLKINEDMLFRLKKWSFLKDDVNKNIIFEHDLIEKSFTQIYKTLPEKCIRNLDMQNFNTAVLGPIQKNYYYLYHTELLDATKIEYILNDSLNLRIPKKFLYAYLTILANTFLEKYDLFSNINNWISDVLSLSCMIKDNIGIEKTIEFQDKVYSFIKNYDADLKKTKEYSNFISFYCENNDESGNSFQARKIINTYFNETGFDSDIGLTYDQKRNISMLENRRHVYYRHSIIEPEKNCIVLKCIERAKKLSIETDYFQMQYTNLSDEGYLYYFNKKQKYKVKNLWEKACAIFNNHDIPDRTLNYFRKKTQLALMDNDLKKAKNFCQQGFDYIEDGEYAYQRLFFKNWFTLANIEILLMENPDLNRIEIKENIASAHEYQLLLKSEKNFNLHHLYALACYYFGEYNTMFDEFKKAYKISLKSFYKSHINDKINYILNNFWLMTYYDKNSFERQLDFLKPAHSSFIESIYSLDKIAFKQKKDGFYNESLLSMQDEKISIPTL